jgi:hypothetical protein
MLNQGSESWVIRKREIANFLRIRWKCLTLHQISIGKEVREG